MAANPPTYPVAIPALAPPADPNIRYQPAPAINAGDPLSDTDMVAAECEYEQLKAAGHGVAIAEKSAAKKRKVAVEVQHATAQYPGIGVAGIHQVQQFIQQQFQQQQQFIQQQFQQQQQQFQQQQQQFQQQFQQQSQQQYV